MKTFRVERARPERPATWKLLLALTGLAALGSAGWLAGPAAIDLWAARQAAESTARATAHEMGVVAKKVRAEEAQRAADALHHAAERSLAAEAGAASSR